MSSEPIRAIAFHLPQFHPIPENDLWWGKGFTEWTNVAKARPLFEGHYQPHLPADLGFYDLRLPEVRQAQADMAREHGIHGFCYYHYWFNGRRLLERPVNEILASGQPDFPFCLCWANENWTRRWDGLDQELLQEQIYSAEDDLAHIRALLPIFKDPRYIKVDGRPFFLVYRLGRLPEPEKTIGRWREEALKAGFPGLYLANVESFPADHGLAERLPLDAAVEFAPDAQVAPFPIRPLIFQPPAFVQKGPPWTENYIYEYGDMVAAMSEKPPVSYVRFPCVTPMWDNAARRQKGASVACGSTPEIYGNWLARVRQKFQPPSKEENFIFINAWNEWGEGNHLEPCQKWGHRYLQATQKALAGCAPAVETLGTGVGFNGQQPKVSICIPTYNGRPHLQECLESVRTQTFKDFEVLICDDQSPDGTLDYARELAGMDSRFRFIQNPQRFGLVGNWNNCIELARGEWIKFVFQDDIIAPTCLEKLLRACEQTGQDFSFCGRSFIFEHSVNQKIRSDLVGHQAELDAIYQKDAVVTPARAAEAVLEGSSPNIVGEPTVTLIRKSLFAKYGRFDDSLIQLCDGEFWVRILSNLGAAWVPERLAVFRVHAKATTSSNHGARPFRTVVLDPLVFLHRLSFHRNFTRLRRMGLPGRFPALRGMTGLRLRKRCAAAAWVAWHQLRQIEKSSADSGGAIRKEWEAVNATCSGLGWLRRCGKWIEDLNQFKKSLAGSRSSPAPAPVERNEKGVAIP